MAQIDWSKLTRDDHDAITRIVDRAFTVWPRGVELDRLGLTMDIGAVHATVGMRLAELADADDFNFAHDVFGIYRHLDRNTGQLTDCFLPRFAS